MESNEANFCKGYNYNNGRFIFNFRGAVSKISDYVFSDGHQEIIAKLSELARKSDLSQNIIAKTFNAQVTVKANEGYTCDVPFTVPDGYELLDVVDTYILGTPASLSQQGIVEDKIKVYLQPFYNGSGGVYVKVLFKKKS